MSAFFTIPFELQILIVAGYFAYKISTIGRAKAHRTEEFFLQVATFGIVARMLSALLIIALPAPWTRDIAVTIVLTFLCTIAGGVLIGAIWRAYLENRLRETMKFLKVYRDDHENSVWQSMINENFKWTVVQVHLQSGKVLEANFGTMAPKPKNPILINEDGIGMYVTGIYDQKGAFAEHGITGNDDDYTFSYIPRSQIEQIDVSWRIPTRELT